MDLNYYNTFIEVAADCPVTVAIEPGNYRDQKTIAQLEYELLSMNPYKFTQEEVLFNVYASRQGMSKSELKANRDAMWKDFFSKSRACLRASMLPKKYGWGLHFDAKGRVALIAMESKEYKEFKSGKNELTVLKAMRNKKQAKGR